MSQKNTVIAGDYEGATIERKVKLIGGNKVYLHKSKFLADINISLDKNSVAAYEVVDEQTKTSATSAIARGAVGTVLLGPIGIAAALSAKKTGLHTLSITFKDGKNSLIAVDTDTYNDLTKLLYGCTPNNAEPQEAEAVQQSATVQEVGNSNQIDAAAEIAKFKKLLDDGAITQAEYEAKKKQLLGL